MHSVRSVTACKTVSQNIDRHLSRICTFRARPYRRMCCSNHICTASISNPAGTATFRTGSLPYDGYRGKGDRAWRGFNQSR